MDAGWPQLDLHPTKTLALMTFQSIPLAPSQSSRAFFGTVTVAIHDRDIAHDEFYRGLWPMGQHENSIEFSALEHHKNSFAGPAQSCGHHQTTNELVDWYFSSVDSPIYVQFSATIHNVQDH